jgi:hypothetical protein
MIKLVHVSFSFGEFQCAEIMCSKIESPSKNLHGITSHYVHEYEEEAAF